MLSKGSTTSKDWYDKLYFLPKWGVKCARRASWTKLPIRISAQSPTFAWILLLLSTCCSSQPTGLCYCCPVPSETCASAALCHPKPVLVLPSATSPSPTPPAITVSRTRVAWKRDMSRESVYQSCPCSLTDNHKTDLDCFSGPNQLLTIKMCTSILCHKLNRVLLQHLARDYEHPLLFSHAGQGGSFLSFVCLILFFPSPLSPLVQLQRESCNYNNAAPR